MNDQHLQRREISDTELLFVRASWQDADVDSHRFDLAVDASVDY